MNDAPHSKTLSKPPVRRRRRGIVGRPSAAVAQQRDAAVLEAACELLLDRGHRAFSLGAVTRQAHVAGRTLYTRFGGRRGLLVAVVAHASERLAAGPARARAGAPLHSTLVDFGWRYVRRMSRPSAVALRRLVLAEAGMCPEAAAAYAARLVEPTRMALASYFGRADVRAQLDRRLRETDLADAYLGVAGRYLDAIALGQANAPSGKTAREWATASVDLFLHGALARPHAPLTAMESA